MAANKQGVNDTPKTKETKGVAKSVEKTPVKKQTSIAEIREWYDKNKTEFDKFENFKKNNDAVLNLRDVQQSKRYTKISNFSKDLLREYLRNPSSNEKNLRNLSRYLVYRSQVYYRLLYYNASMFELGCRSIIPNHSLVEENDKQAVLKSYYNTVKFVDRMCLQREMLKVYFTCFREDVFYGCCYYDDTADLKNSFFILPIDSDYCKIQGVWEDGVFAYAMNMNYFKGKQDLLEFWGEPFTSMYNESIEYDINWITMPREYSICMKFRNEDWETVVPPFAGILNAVISLIDQEDISAIADQQEIYKLIWMELETMGDDEPDNWKVNPMTSLPYWNRMVEEALPDYTSSAIVPGKLNTISFDNDQATDTSKVQTATKTVLNASGGAQALCSATSPTASLIKLWRQVDTEYAISSLLPQTEAWLNSYIALHISNPSKVKFFEISAYTKEDFRSQLLTNGERGLPTKLALNTMNGFSELDTLALNFLEEDCLNITEKLVPLSTSYTQSADSNSTGGAPTKDDGELSDEGEKTKDGDKNDQ